MSENKRIPYGESWTCAYGECCVDERCERWTWRVCVMTSIVIAIVGAAAIVQLVMR